MEFLTSNVQVWQVVCVAVGWWIGWMIVYVLRDKPSYVTRRDAENDRNAYTIWWSAMEQRQKDTLNRVNQIDERLTESIIANNDNFDSVDADIEYLLTPLWKRKVAEWIGLFE